MTYQVTCEQLGIFKQFRSLKNATHFRNYMVQLHHQQTFKLRVKLW